MASVTDTVGSLSLTKEREDNLCYLGCFSELSLKPPVPFSCELVSGCQKSSGLPVGLNPGSLHPASLNDTPDHELLY